MADLLVDSDVLIDHLRGSRPFVLPEQQVSYSIITRAELFAGYPPDEDAVQSLLAPLRELAVDREIAELAGQLRRGGHLALPDALIAATALVHRLTLLTRNRRHFERVPRLRLMTPGGGT